jgi:ABC-type branched-subunit amino acid transport system substrate-binding protein
MTSSAWLRRLALLLTIVLMAAACGNGDDEAAPAPDDDADEDTPVTDTDTEADDTERGDGTLRLAYLLPETGQLQFLGPPMIAAVQMAVEDINEAGGVLGNDVTLDGGDEAGDAGAAGSAVERLLADGADAIIGAAASGMSLAVIDQITGSEVVQCSPSNTSPSFTDYDDGGYYFRTAPTDFLQGPVLAETMIGDGHTNIALMARADDYGQGFAEVTQDNIDEAGGQVVDTIIYDPEAASFDSEIQQVLAGDPDAVAIIGFDESAQILQGLIEAGAGPGDFPVYGGESLRSSELPELVDPGNPNVLDGLKGTAPVSRADPEFVERLEAFDESLTDTLFAGEAYDCTIVIALAAAAAGSDDPTDFVDEINAITQDGTECTSFQECLDLIEQGEDINYNGASGPLEFTDAGEPARGVYEIWEFSDGEIETIDEQESTL